MLFLKIKASKNSQSTTARLQGKKIIQFKEGLNQGPLDLKSVAALVVQWVRAFATKQKVGCSNPSRDRPKLFKQVVTVPLLKVRH